LVASVSLLAVGCDSALLEPEDVEPPQLEISSPSSGSSTYAGSVNVQGVASDDRGVTRITYRIGSGTEHTAPTTAGKAVNFDFMVDGLADGLNSITVTAWDRAENSASKTISVRRDDLSQVCTPPADYLAWHGIRSSDWSEAGNWHPAGVPSASQNAFICAAAPHQPVISSSISVANLSIPRNSVITVGGRHLNVGGNLEVEGTLRMRSAADTVTVEGAATFSSTTATVDELSAGVLNVGGNFSVPSWTGSNRFAPGAGFKVVFNGTSAQSVSMRLPGAESDRYHFRDVDILNGVGVTFADELYISGRLRVLENGKLNANSINFTSAIPQTTASGYNVATTYLVGAWTLSEPLEVTLPGTLVVDGTLNLAGKAMHVANHLSVTGTLRMRDAADVLTVGGNVVFRTAHAISTELSAGVLNVGGNFSVPSWSGSDRFAPGAGFKVVFNGTSAQSVSMRLPGAESDRYHFRDVDILNGVGVTFADELYISGRLRVLENGKLNANSINFTSAIPQTTASGYNVATSYLVGAWTLSEPLEVTLPGTLVVDGTLNLAGKAMHVANHLSVTGTLRMRDAADVLTVGGNVVFRTAHAISTELSAGVLNVGGNFSVPSWSGSDRFAPGAGFKVVFNGTSAQSVSMRLPGAESDRYHFRDVLFANASGVTMESDIFVNGSVDIKGLLDTNRRTAVVSQNVILLSGAILNNTGTVEYNGTYVNEGGTVTGNEPLKQ
jgi:hypothetical protein